MTHSKHYDQVHGYTYHGHASYHVKKYKKISIIESNITRHVLPIYI
jgi:hypothetical protein